MKDVKQKLFSKFSRHDKSEAPHGWPDDVDQIEHIADEMRRVSGDVVKRMSACQLSGGGGGSVSGTQPPAFTGGFPAVHNTVTMSPAEKDKRLRKLPESALSQTMLESAEKFASLNPNLRAVFTLCGEALNRLSEERLTWENQTEAQVLECFRQCSEEEVPLVMRLRKQLWKLNGELRAAKERLRLLETGSTPGQNHSTNQTHSSTDALASSLNASSMNNHYPNDDIALNSSLNHSVGNDSSKLQQARIFKEDLEAEVNHLKDQCLKEMYRFDGALVSYARAVMEYLALEAEYHRNSLQILDSVVPKIRNDYLGHCSIPVFGRDLLDHLTATRRSICYVFEVCIHHLNTPANLEEEGLFRIAGSKSKVDTLTSAMNVMRAEKIIDQYDAFVIADSLKQYLRSLPEPLLTYHLFDKWIASIANNSGTQDQLTALWYCCSALPPANWLNLAHLVRYLFRLAQHSNKNKMTASNLGIIFGQSLLSHPSQDVSSSSPIERTRRQTPGHNNNNISLTSRVRKTSQSRDASPPIISAPQMGHQKKGSMGSYSLESFTGGFNSANSPSTANNPNCDELSAKLISSNSQGVIVELLITHCQVFFPEEISDQRLVPQPQFSPGGRSRILTRHDEYHHHHSQSSRSLRAQYLSGGKEQEIRPVRAQGVESSASCNDRQELLEGRPRRSSIHDSYGYTPSSHEPSPVANAPSSVDPKNFPSTFYRRRTSDGAAARSKSAVRTAHLQDIQFDDSPNDSNPSQVDASKKSSGHKPPYAAKSFHADVYDTLFALQSLNSQNGGSDYLSRVRSVYEGRTLTKPVPGASQATAGSRSIRESGSPHVPHVAPKDWIPGGNAKPRVAKIHSDSSAANRLPPRRDMFSSYSEDRAESRVSDIELIRQLSNSSDKTRHLTGVDGTQSLKKAIYPSGTDSRRTDKTASMIVDSPRHRTRGNNHQSNNEELTNNSLNQSLPVMPQNFHSPTGHYNSSTSARQSGSNEQEPVTPHNTGTESHSQSNGLSLSSSLYQQFRSSTLPSRSKLEAPLSCLTGPIVTDDLSIETDDVTTPTSSPPISAQMSNFSPSTMPSSPIF